MWRQHADGQCDSGMSEHPVTDVAMRRSVRFRDPKEMARSWGSKLPMAARADVRA
jgi:hypothetical protein